jgi:hypothetical protein
MAMAGGRYLKTLGIPVVEIMVAHNRARPRSCHAPRIAGYTYTYLRIYTCIYTHVL